MDYRHKMVVPSSQKYKHEDDDDEDLEALRMAALKSLKAKTPGASIKATALIQQPTISQTHSFPPYSNQRVGVGGGRRDYYYPNRPLRQNGNVYYPSRNNQNLIEIIPVEENANPPESDVDKKVSVDTPISTEVKDGSKFQRYTDNVSGSDEEDARDTKDSVELKPMTKPEDENNDDVGTDKENQTGVENSSTIEETEAVPEEDEEEEEDDEDKDDDDDDVLLMADLEEEDSLERLMDEMEREMTEDKPKSEKKEKKCSRKDGAKESKKGHESVKSRTNKLRERTNETVDNSSTASHKNDRRSVSPHDTNKVLGKHRSVSPKLKLRKKSPRRSPSRRSSPPQSRQLKKSQRDMRLRSPRKSPPKYSPRPRSPKLSPRPRSPRMSPRRSPIRRSPQRKSSPRGISQSRSPLRRHSRSRSPRTVRLRSPRNSPARMSPRSRSPFQRSPKVSPHRSSPRRLSPRTRSPKLSPRRTSPLLSRARSPKLSPSRRVSPRTRSPPHPSPHKSPWSSPRNSPRLSPRRRRSPPKELSKKNRPRSITPEDIVGVINHKRESTPIRRNISSPELSRTKTKVLSLSKETNDMSSDPVLEARRRKFESTKPIDPVHDNKKIKLSRKDSVNVSKKSQETLESAPEIDSPHRNTQDISEDDYELPEAELCLHDNYDFDELEEHISDESTLANAAVTICVEEPPVKVEKERVKKKKKKDKELYQVGKLKGGELPLSERIGKEKKCKKRKDVITDNVKEEVDAVVDESLEEETDLRTELSRRRAERLNRTAPIQSARLLQSAFKGLAKEVVKDSTKAMQRNFSKGEEKSNSKEIRRVTVLHRAVPDLDNSDDETIDSKVPIRFRLGINKATQETRESKNSRKSSKRQGRKVKHKHNLIVNDIERS